MSPLHLPASPCISLHLPGQEELEEHTISLVSPLYLPASPCISLHLPGQEDLEEHTILGTGTFGIVKLVKHRPTGNTYALKVPPP